MKSTGIVRKVDLLGRIVLPMELRRVMNISEKDGIEISVDGERLVLCKYLPTCVFCGTVEDLSQFRGKNLCSACRKALIKLGQTAEVEGEGER